MLDTLRQIHVLGRGRAMEAFRDRASAILVVTSSILRRIYLFLVIILPSSSLPYS